jgi:glycosyltransferase involved in cell wall biosynthesis
MHLYLPHWREYLRRVVCDGVHVLHLTTPGPLGLVALWVASRTGLPIVGSFHTDFAAYTRVLSGWPRLGLWMRDYLQWMYGRCAITLVPSQHTHEMLVKDGASADRVVVWTRGVDPDQFRPDRRSPILRARWRVSDRRPAILYVGRLSREKGLQTLPAVLQELRATGVPHRLIVAGDGPLRPWLAQHCPEAVFTGWLGREDVAEAFASADVFLFPSRTDTAGNVILEAQASGLPVVVSDAGGPRENMVDGVTGVVCHGDDPRRWAFAVGDLLREHAARQTLGRAAMHYAASRRWETALTPVYDVYRHAIQDGDRREAGVHHAA